MKLGLRLSQSRPLYEAFKQLKEQRWGELTTAQRRAVDAEIRDFVLGGVALEVCHRATCAAQQHVRPHEVTCQSAARCAGWTLGGQMFGVASVIYDAPFDSSRLLPGLLCEPCSLMRVGIYGHGTIENFT